MVQKEMMPIHFPGITKEQEAEIEARLQEFERDHEPDVVNGGAGYVPKIKNGDFIAAWAVNIVLGIYFFWAILA